jgi:hypothetical protein
MEEIVAFVQALVDLEKALENDPRLERPETVLVSQAWQDLQAAATRIIQLPAIKGLTL